MRKTILFSLSVLLAASGLCAPLDLRTAAIVVRSGAPIPQRTAARMLSEEIEKRTQLRLKIASEMPAEGAAIVLKEEINSGGKPEGFTLVSSPEGQRPLVTVSGNDDRGVVFGAGYLLRKLDMARQRLELAPGLKVTSAPSLAIRGEQLGYRPKTNAYDAWSMPMWEQYIRELAIFGVNTIELIPPRSDDAPDSPHFPLPQMEMMVEMSRIANEYGLNVSIWYPAMDRDYSDPKTVEAALKEWGDVFKRLPRVDAIFTPGGDPGHTEPKYLLALLEKQAANLRRYHPNAQVWVSPQSFDQKWLEEFYGLLRQDPKWLTGVVFGPQVRGSIEEVRARVPSRYPIRFYPDITHSIHCEFPVADWDWAFATTEGREGINPRPVAESEIFQHFRKYVAGFVTYSEGCNDDVNKFIWAELGWNPDASARDILADYARFFIGGDLADGFARGLLALEQNWRGALLSNAGVETTLEQFQQMEKRATPQQKLNWRFQEALYRAYYDAYLRSRLMTETEQEELADGELMRAKRLGSLKAMDAAERVLDEDRLTPVARTRRARVFELAEALFQSIHMQLSVPRYQAIALGRGANLDAIDFALSNRVWLERQFQEIRAMGSESERLARIGQILNWTNPGPGGFYDDLGDPARQPHLVKGESYRSDPDFLKSPFVGFGERPPEKGWRTSWYTDAESLFDQPLRMRYTGLDPDARYRLRVIYGGDMQAIPIRLVADGKYPIHPFLKKSLDPVPVEFDIPVEATRGGELTLEWTRPPGLGGSGRGCQVSEVWLIPSYGTDQLP